jgi:hypothetical protein
VTVGICAIIGSLNKSVAIFAKFPSFKIDLKIARDVSEVILVRNESKFYIGPSTLDNVRRYDDV